MVLVDGVQMFSLDEYINTVIESGIPEEAFGQVMEALNAYKNNRDKGTTQ